MELLDGWQPGTRKEKLCEKDYGKFALGFRFFLLSFV